MDDLNGMNMNLGVFSNHPVIINNDQYSLKKEYLSIHSIDRNTDKWNSSAEFEINLPQKYNNVYTMKLISIQMPKLLNNISNSLQNTKLSFTFTDLNSNSSENSIVLEDGYYSPANLAQAIQNKMNEQIMNKCDGGVHGVAVIEPIVCKYNTSTGQFIFGSSEGTLVLKFGQEEMYQDPCGKGKLKSMFSDLYWGLGYYLGFDKTNYTSVQTAIGESIYQTTKGGLVLPHESTAWITPTFVVDGQTDNKLIHTVTSPNAVNLTHNNKIYMEVDKYNYINEMVPFVNSTTNRYNNDEAFKTNGCFAIIPVRSLNFEQNNESTLGHLNLKSVIYPPIQNIRKLKFRFRNHLDKLVDFKNQDVSFVLEFGSLKKGGDRKIDMTSVLTEIA